MYIFFRYHVISISLESKQWMNNKRSLSTFLDILFVLRLSLLLNFFAYFHTFTTASLITHNTNKHLNAEKQKKIQMIRNVPLISDSEVCISFQRNIFNIWRKLYYKTKIERKKKRTNNTIRQTKHYKYTPIRFGEW